MMMMHEKSKMRQIPRRCRPVAGRPAGSTFLKCEHYQQLPLNDYLFHFAILIIIFNNNTQRT